MDITNCIEASGRSRADICAAVGISRGMLSLIESGQRRISAEKALVFANTIGASVSIVRPDLSELLISKENSEGAA